MSYNVILHDVGNVGMDCATKFRLSMPHYFRGKNQNLVNEERNDRCSNNSQRH